jgi:hypothetical protein
MSAEIDESEESDEDPAFPVQREIAERLATLSEVVDTPTEFDLYSGSFDAGDVDFASGSWMQKLAEVQGWLRLEQELPQDAALFVPALVTAMGLYPATAIDATGEFPQLTLVGLEQLYESLSQAVRLQQLFVDRYGEESATRESATEAWIEAWEDESVSPEPEPLGSISAIAGTYRLSDFTGKKLNLTPSYQRGDVWGTPARQLLIESILRGIPLPSVILLKPEDPTKPHEVVDGKQRLTAILRFVGRHEVAVARVNEVDKEHNLDGQLLKEFQTNYPRFKRRWKSLTHQAVTTKVEDEYYFPFKLRNNRKGLSGPALEPLQGKYYTEIRDCIIEAADERVLVSDLFEGTPEYRVPVIVYKKAGQRQIHEVFHLYNKQGMHLNAEEIRNAIYHELELTRAILVAAGDSDRLDVAPSLDRVWPQVKDLGLTLRSYGFGESRYRRTKVLAWVIATLLGDTQYVDSDGVTRYKDLPSTARHIDDLLDRVRSNPSEPLNQQVAIADLFQWMAASANIHAAYGQDLWSPKFKDGADGQKWRELQLVGSLVGIAIAYFANPDGIKDAVETNADAIFNASATAVEGEQRSVWARPKKATTKSQWTFIAKVAKAVTQLLDVDTHAASEKIRKGFGSSGVESLWDVIRDDAR